MWIGWPGDSTQPDAMFCSTHGRLDLPSAKASVYARSSSEQLGVAAMELRHLIHAYDAVQDSD